jgi:hypothetical protein
MPFTPTTAIDVNVVTPATQQAATVRIVKMSFVMPFGGHPSVTVAVEHVRSDSVVIRTENWSIEDQDGDTPVTTAWTTVVTNGKTRYDEIKDAIYALLQARTNPKTGAPFLPAGTVS